MGTDYSSCINNSLTTFYGGVIGYKIRGSEIIYPPYQNHTVGWDLNIFLSAFNHFRHVSVGSNNIFNINDFRTADNATLLTVYFNISYKRR